MINLIDEDIYDITYIGIGSAVVRDTEPENRQQFPPFIESIYKKTNLKIHIINIDPHFEKPYFLQEYLSNNSFVKNRLKINYIDKYVDIINYDFDWFDTLNKFIMNNNKILICGIYTGEPVNNIENKFMEYYKTTKYQEKFNKYITYNFFNNDNGCIVNLIENFPIINLDNLTLIKTYMIDPDNFIETYNKLKSFDKNKINKKIIKDFTYFCNFNHYVYRNIKNYNIHDELIDAIKLSIFKDDQSPENINEIFRIKLLEYYKIIEFLFGNKYSEIHCLITNLENINDYEWIQNFQKNIFL